MFGASLCASAVAIFVGVGNIYAGGNLGDSHTPRFQTHGMPGSAQSDSVQGRFRAGPCVYYGAYDPRISADTTTQGLMPADLPPEPGAYNNDVVLNYDLRRPRTRVERHFGLRPEDAVTYDTRSGLLLYNGEILTAPLPPEFNPCTDGGAPFWNVNENQ